MAFDVKSIQKTFFDRKAVTDAIDRATKAALSKFGAFVRQRAKTSIRKRKAISAPGSPPSSHEGSLKRLIYFGYDAVRQSVVIGPVPKTGGAEAPALLEYGGTGKRGTYAARPFMRPAFAAELHNAPEKFRVLIK